MMHRGVPLTFFVFWQWWIPNKHTFPFFGRSVCSNMSDILSQHRNYDRYCVIFTIHQNFCLLLFRSVQLAKMTKKGKHFSTETKLQIVNRKDGFKFCNTAHMVGKW